MTTSKKDLSNSPRSNGKTDPGLRLRIGEELKSSARAACTAILSLLRNDSNLYEVRNLAVTFVSDAARSDWLKTFEQVACATPSFIDSKKQNYFEQLRICRDLLRHYAMNQPLFADDRRFPSLESAAQTLETSLTEFQLEVDQFLFLAQRLPSNFEHVHARWQKLEKIKRLLMTKQAGLKLAIQRFIGLRKPQSTSPMPSFLAKRTDCVPLNVLVAGPLGDLCTTIGRINTALLLAQCHTFPNVREIVIWISLQDSVYLQP